MLAGLTMTTMIMIDADDSNERQPVYLAEIWRCIVYTDLPPVAMPLVFRPNSGLQSLAETAIGEW